MKIIASTSPSLYQAVNITASPITYKFTYIFQNRFFRRTLRWLQISIILRPNLRYVERSQSMNQIAAAPINPYIALMRLDKPIGILLLLWPTYWAIWLAAEQLPDWSIVVIFTLGVILMRSAGCVINDYADRNLDAHVKRTKDRPLATGAVSAKQALTLFTGLIFLAAVLVLFTNTKTILMAFVALGLATLYPFMKRYTHFPQIILGAAFSWSIPMAFTASDAPLSSITWLLYGANLCWTVAYDTFYAMVDRDDDVQVGIKSTAVFFGRYDLLAITLLHIATLIMIGLVLVQLQLSLGSVLAFFAACLFSIYLIWCARDRQREHCFKAFRQSHWIGILILASLVLSAG